MRWFTASIIIIGLVFWYARKSKPAKPVKKAPEDKKEVAAESIDAVVASNDPEKMSSALEQTSNPLDRHQLLSAIIQSLYPKREKPVIRTQLYGYGKVYLDEFNKIAPALKSASAPETMDVPAFKCLAITMEEDQRYDEALNICRLAIKWDLDDGTKTGYPGRENRLERKKAAQ